MIFNDDGIYFKLIDLGNEIRRLNDLQRTQRDEFWDMYSKINAICDYLKVELKEQKVNPLNKYECVKRKKD